MDTFCLSRMLIPGPLKHFPMNMSPFNAFIRIYRYDVFYSLDNFLVCNCCLTIEKDAPQNHSCSSKINKVKLDEYDTHMYGHHAPIQQVSARDAALCPGDGLLLSRAAQNSSA
jgi:hypothetical protein